MKKSALGICFIFILLIIPVIFASETRITVKSGPNKRVDIRVYTPDIEKLQELAGEYTDERGEISLVHNSAYAKLYITTYEKGEEDGMNRFYNVSSGGEVYIDLTKSPATLEKTETLQNEEEDSGIYENGTLDSNNSASQEEGLETNSSEESIKKSITGGVIVNTKKIFGLKVIRYIGGIFAIGALVFVIFMAKTKIRLKKGNSANFKITPLSVIKASPESDEKIEEIERKLEEARKELENIKNRKSKIEEAKAKFEKDREELERLQKEE